MAKGHDELLDHEYDGIREYDNPLPAWWLWLFYATIAFSLVFIPYYLLGFGPSEEEEYRQAVAAVAAAKPAQAGGGQPGQSSNAAAPVPTKSLAGDSQAIAAGKALFAANCAPCHGPQAQGGIGPNLTDNFWLHGNTWTDVVNVITNGVPDKGMIAWKATLNPAKIDQAAAFVLSLKGSKPPNPKPPQGKEYPE
jgi:cytochrome c oxidase cbb3-type subunit 3